MASGAPPMGDLPPGPPLNPLLLTGPDPRSQGLWQVLFSFASWDHEAHAGYFAVLVVFLVEILTTGLMTYSAWKTFVSGWGNPMALLEIPWSSAALNPIAGCRRTYILPWAVVIFSLGQLGICLYVSTEFARASSLLDVGGALDNVYIAWLSTSAFCDLLVCGSLLHVLFGAQRQLAMGPTRPLISRVITLTMETTVLTTVAAATRFHFMMFLMLMKM
ncbi:hypothetical protein EV121DRAFT_270625 [Schizophyllum commune]